MTPLLAEGKPQATTQAKIAPELNSLPSTYGKVKVFNEEEETTKILEMRYLHWSCPKRFLLVPLLSILTGFFFLLFLYWYPRLRKRFLYSEASSAARATHLFIVGTRKSQIFDP